MRVQTRIAVVTVAVAAILVGCGDKRVPVASTPPPPPPPKPVNIAKGGDAPPLAQPVRIDNFTVEPSAIERGQSATLRWTVANSGDITIDQGLGAVQANGSRQVFPTATTTYTLTARANGMSDSRSVTVEVRMPAPAPPPAPRGPDIDTSTLFRSGIQDVYFDYDMSELRPDARDAVSSNADVLRRIFQIDPAFNVVLEGHADERGTSEYNLGLSDRRGSAVRDYLVQLGIPANRLRTISFGEERPVCTDATESCYQRNRRVHFEPAQ